MLYTMLYGKGGSLNCLYLVGLQALVYLATAFKATVVIDLLVLTKQLYSIHVVVCSV